MTVRILFVILALLVTGCASTGRGSIFRQTEQEKKLTRAVELLEQKKTSAAAELLTAVCGGPGVPGVTDEALFRLSVLHLAPGQDKGGVARARQELERLKREYPTSSWTTLANILAETQGSADDHRQQLRKLKELNFSLTRDNRELRQSIEKLKTLELELSKGSKR